MKVNSIALTVDFNIFDAGGPRPWVGAAGLGPPGLC
jgi:hypothetical protein